MAQQFSGAPYLNSYGVQDRYSYNGEIAPEMAIEEQALNRKQQIANLLMQQGLQGAGQGQMVGRFYVPTSGTQHAAKIGELLAGLVGTHLVDKKREALSDEMNTERARAVQSYIQQTRGVPEHALPEGEQGPVNPAIPADAASKKEAITRALTSRVPGLPQMAKMDYEQMNKPPIQVQAGDRTIFLDPSTMQPINEIRHNVTPDAALSANKPMAVNAGDKTVLINPLTGQPVTEVKAGQTPDSVARLAQDADQFGKVSAGKRAEIDAANTRHGTASGSAILEDKTKRELYPIASGNALAAADAQTAVAMNAHLDRVAQMEQNKRQDEATLELRRQQGLSDQEYKRDKAAMEDKWHKTQADLEREKINIQKSTVQQGKTPPGYRQTQDGNLEAIPGGPADTKLQGALNADTAMLQGTNASMDRLSTAANALLNHPGIAGITGIRGKVPDIPGSDAANARADLNNLKSQIAFTVMQELRNNSKSGSSGLGALSDAEGKRLEAAIASLDTTQGTDQFKQRLQAIIDYANGAKDRLRDAFNMKHNGGEPKPMAPSTQGPKVGTVEGGYRFKGGDPGKAESWEKVQ